MAYQNQKNRPSIRIPEYETSQPGAYFVTLVTHDRQCLFGEIIAGRMELSPLGRIAEEQWLRLQVRFPNWATETFQIMPNHMHGVLNKRGTLAVGAQRSINNAGSKSVTLRPASDIKGESLPEGERGRVAPRRHKPPSRRGLNFQIFFTRECFLIRTGVK